ncbi:MAG TPA: cellulase family glycosylhydrolase [Polyangiaceae bacterium]|nr:cellulase family glycosylhydrolase [Polyangiaceae bacterium]
MWFQNDALTWMDEIATTDSNSVRIVWETTRGAPDIVRAAIERAVELGMVPMVEMHDVTGSPDLTGPARMAQYYVDEMRDILLEFEPYLLINIANEWGDFQTQDADWVQAYQQAIAVLRDAGINHTLVIDASNSGQKGSVIVAEGAELLEGDPQHNVLFSKHMYQDYENPQRILDVLRGAKAASLPIIVGEFGFQHGSRNGEPIAVPYTVMIDEAARLGLPATLHLRPARQALTTPDTVRPHGGRARAEPLASAAAERGDLPTDSSARRGRPYRRPAPSGEPLRARAARHRRPSPNHPAASASGSAPPPVPHAGLPQSLASEISNGTLSKSSTLITPADSCRNPKLIAIVSLGTAAVVKSSRTHSPGERASKSGPLSHGTQS